MYVTNLCHYYDNRFWCGFRKPIKGFASPFCIKTCLCLHFQLEKQSKPCPVFHSSFTCRLDSHIIQSVWFTLECSNVLKVPKSSHFSREMYQIHISLVVQKLPWVVGEGKGEGEEETTSGPFWAFLKWSSASAASLPLEICIVWN